MEVVLTTDPHAGNRPGARQLPRDKSNLVVKGVEAAYKYIEQEVPVLRYWTLNRIPFAKGMGSSSAVRSSPFRGVTDGGGFHQEFLRLDFWSRSAASGELRAEVVTLGDVRRYKETNRILFLGEANFSFAAAVQKSFDARSGITASSYESKEELLKRFQIKRRLRSLANWAGAVGQTFTTCGWLILGILAEP
eukprot:s3439_g2.t2